MITICFEAVEKRIKTQTYQNKYKSCLYWKRFMFLILFSINIKINADIVHLIYLDLFIHLEISVVNKKEK